MEKSKFAACMDVVGLRSWCSQQ